jgi:hypothetical protein
MKINNGLRLQQFFIRLTRWEHWPWKVFIIPVLFYWLWLSLRARSFTFFTASNPGIDMGGMFGESKFEILQKIPEHLRAVSVRICLPATLSDITAQMEAHHLRFPVIFKPDVGERGYRVERIHNEKEALSYLKEAKSDIIIQELVDLQVECGVFYVRRPDARRGRVTSVNLKEMLSVTGDGTSTIGQLILKNERALLQWERLKARLGDEMNCILAAGQTMVLNHIGNHCLGTKFISGQHLINEKLHQIFDDVAQRIEGFYFGRFDLRCASLDDLYAGRFKIMELNGCSSEPAHIYDPGFPLLHAYKVVFWHWKEMFLISRINHKNGINYVPLREALRRYKKYKAAVA